MGDEQDAESIFEAWVCIFSSEFILKGNFYPHKLFSENLKKIMKFEKGERGQHC